MLLVVPWGVVNRKVKRALGESSWDEELRVSPWLRVSMLDTSRAKQWTQMHNKSDLNEACSMVGQIGVGLFVEVKKRCC